jgi:drug/metabolite transporter (DMT)-like permease
VGAAFGGEVLGVRDVLGALLVIAGVTLSLVTPKRRVRAESSSVARAVALAGAAGD